MPCPPKRANANRRLRPHLGQIAACGYYSFAKERATWGQPPGPRSGSKAGRTKAGRWCKPRPSTSLSPSAEQRYTSPAAVAVLFLCAFSSLAGPTFEQIGFLADFHQPALFVVGQFTVIDLVLLTEQHHQLFNLAALDLRDFL